MDYPGDVSSTRSGSAGSPAARRWRTNRRRRGSSDPLVQKIYYHYGLDIGGGEAMVEVVAATDGLVVSAGKTSAGHTRIRRSRRATTSSICSTTGAGTTATAICTAIDPAVKPGAKVKMGQTARPARQGGGQRRLVASALRDRRPAAVGQVGHEEGYAFLWEAYRDEHKPALLAVARPHHLIRVGDTVELDGSRSWRPGKVASYTWTFCDGITADGDRRLTRVIEAGLYSEMLEIREATGHVDYDFCRGPCARQGTPRIRCRPPFMPSMLSDFRNRAGR